MYAGHAGGQLAVYIRQEIDHLALCFCIPQQRGFLWMDSVKEREKDKLSLVVVVLEGILCHSLMYMLYIHAGGLI